MIVALSGPAAAGKGTIARMLSQELGLPHYDFGLIYRGIVFMMSRYSPDDISLFIAHRYFRLQEGLVRFRWINLDPFLQTEEMGLRTAQIANITPNLLVTLSQAMVTHESFICDGRTCGTELYPYAEYKFYVTANMDNRIERRIKEKQNKTFFLQREALDKKRVHIPESCIHIDTTGKTPEVSLKEVLSYIVKK